MTIGQRLKLMRGSLSQAKAAEMLGIPQTTWSNYENNRNKPDFDLVDLVCSTFRVKTDWLLFGRGPMRHEEEAESPQKRESAPTSVALCAHCLALEQKIVKKLESFEEERRELTTELRQLWKENAHLREENATLRERQYQRTGQGDSEPMGHAG